MASNISHHQIKENMKAKASKKAIESIDDGAYISRKDSIVKSAMELFHERNSTISQTNGSTVKSNDEKILKNENPLHKFATYNTLFTLSALTEAEIRNPIEYLQNPVHDVIARSAGIGPNFRTAGKDPLNAGQNKKSMEGVDRGFQEGLRKKAVELGFNTISASQSILKRNHDIFFENVNIISTVSPSEERNTMSFTKMDFELHEPYSITFVEKIRAAAYNSGYLDYQDAPYLLTIEWKGNSQAGAAGAVPTNKDKLYTGELANGEVFDHDDIITRKIPIVISRVEFDVTEGGAVYQIQAAAYSEFAMMDRFHLTRTDMTIQETTFTNWGHKFSLEMAKQMQTEIEQGARSAGYEDQYIFQFDPKLSRLCKNLHSTTATIVTGHKTNSPKVSSRPKGSPEYVNKTEIPPNTSVLKVMEDTIMATSFFQALVKDFWLEYLTGSQILGENDRKVFSVSDVKKKIPFNKSNQQKLADLAARNTMIPWFKIISTVHTDIDAGIDPITKMYPKIIIYKAVYYEFHILKLLLPGMSIGKVNWENHVNKRYNYIYTGDNIDIQNLRINYKTGYYHRNIIGKPSAGIEKVVDSIKRGWSVMWGQEPVDVNELAPLRSYPSITKSSNITSGQDAEEQVEMSEFFDYLVNPNADMMKVEMEILGDPSYIAQDMYVTLSGAVVAKKPMNMHDGAWNDQLNCFNIDNSMPLIHLKYRMPADINDATGTMFDTKKGQLTADSNLFFSGIYQVSKVESSIKNGAFTQILHMVRLNNQQGIGVAPFQNTNITSAFVQKNTDGGKNVYTDESMFGILDYDETSPLNEKQTEKLNNLGKKQFIEGKLPWELDK